MINRKGDSIHTLIPLIHPYQDHPMITLYSFFTAMASIVARATVELGLDT